MENFLWYRIFRFLFNLIPRTLHRCEVLGAENVPETGGVMLVANHRSLIDPPLVGGAVKRRVFFIAKESLFKLPVLGWLMHVWGMLPVKRGRADREAIITSINALESGKAFGIFIEGTRNKTTAEMLPPKHGAAMIATKTNAPVVPMALVNTQYFLRSFKKIWVVIGKPMDFQEFEHLERKEKYEAISQKITQEIIRLSHTVPKM